MNTETITLEDNIEYLITKKVQNEGNTYIFLNNLSDPNDFCIRKLINRDGKEILTGLDKEEFDKVISL